MFVLFSPLHLAQNRYIVCSFWIDKKIMWNLCYWNFVYLLVIACQWAPFPLSWREQNASWISMWIHRMQKRCSGAEFLHQVFDYLNLNEREFFGIQIIPHHHHGEFVVRTISLIWKWYVWPILSVFNFVIVFFTLVSKNKQIELGRSKQTTPQARSQRWSSNLSTSI